MTPALFPSTSLFLMFIVDVAMSPGGPLVGNLKEESQVLGTICIDCSMIDVEIGVLLLLSSSPLTLMVAAPPKNGEP